MKIRKMKIVFSLFAIAAGYIVINGYNGGPAAAGAYDCSGAETGLGNPTGCFAGSGCHSSVANAGIAVTLEFDSAGTPTTHYVAGKAYTVTITGTNNTSNNLPRFGLQIGCIKGATPSAAPTQTGTWMAPYPTNTRYTAPFTKYYLVGVVEHSTRLTPFSGSGGNGTVYKETFNWTAPVSGTDTISFWGALNAVNNNGNADGGDLWNVTHIIIYNWSPTAVVSIQNTAFNMGIFPNPASQHATLKYSLKENSNVQADLYNICGQKVCTLFNGTQTAGAHTQLINLADLNLKSGIYMVAINDGAKSSTQKLIVQ